MQHTAIVLVAIVDETPYELPRKPDQSGGPAQPVRTRQYDGQVASEIYERTSARIASLSEDELAATRSFVILPHMAYGRQEGARAKAIRALSANGSTWHVGQRVSRKKAKSYHLRPFAK